MDYNQSEQTRILSQNGIITAKSPLWMDVACFLIPSFIFVEIKLLGRLFAPELFLLLTLLFLAQQWPRLSATLPKKLLILGGFWLLSQVVTDVIRSTPFVDYSRGWLKIIFILVNFSAIYLLIGGMRRRILLFAWGVAFGQVLQYFLNPSVYAQGNVWKFGIGAGITLIIVLIGQLLFIRHKQYIAMGLIAGAATLNFVMGFRSLGAIALVTVGYLIVQRYQKKTEIPEVKLNLKRSIIFLAMAVIIGYGIILCYGHAAKSGWLGEEAQDRYELQASGKYGVLLGGRTELLVSSIAIMDSPIIGHGSWAKDQKYVDLLAELIILYDYEKAYLGESELIPTHSFLFGAWVESGILGAVFWLWIISIIFRVLFYMFRIKESLSPLIVFTCFTLGWNILFSPFGAEHRFYTGFYISILLFAWGSIKYIEKNQQLRT